MSVFVTLRGAIATSIDALVKASSLSLSAPVPAFTVEPPRDPSHGDISTNAAMVLTKLAGKPPRQIAELIVAELAKHPLVDKADIAGPGFINLRLKPDAWHAEIKQILANGVCFGDSTIGNKLRVNIEFVSANPTGPMHAGHVRGAVIGDTLANLLRKAGFDVTKEYYFNDAGAQVDVLARTTFLRYREALGEDIGAIPEGLYPGEYLKDVAQTLAKRDGKKWLGQDEAAWLVPIRDFAVQFIMGLIRQDLDLIGIHHDVFTNEREMIENGTLEKSFKILEERDLIYVGTLPPPRGKTMEDWEPTPLTLFRSSKFGDATDRPLKKRDGTWAYIMPDIAYHYDKLRRDYQWMINVLGKDHGGYLERMRPAVAAMSDGKAKLDVIYNSIVKVFKNGEPVKLSKRSGNIITLREIVEEVGPGAVRFFMMSRTPDTELEFDFAKVVEQSRDNPVFYVQYAHARCCSVLRMAAEMFPQLDQTVTSLAAGPLHRLTHPDELQLIKNLAGWPRVVEAAAEAHEPHRITYYLIELAGAFHGIWNKGREDNNLRFLHANDPELSAARAALIQSVRTVIASGLAVLGVQPLEELRDAESAAA
jgi:arginyl-tRNA synthetase